jgi:hypothetical protein
VLRRARPGMTRLGEFSQFDWLYFGIIFWKLQ